LTGITLLRVADFVLGVAGRLGENREKDYIEVIMPVSLSLI
jgi:hypothetical protein